MRFSYICAFFVNNNMFRGSAYIFSGWYENINEWKILRRNTSMQNKYSVFSKVLIELKNTFTLLLLYFKMV